MADDVCRKTRASIGGEPKRAFMVPPWIETRSRRLRRWRFGRVADAAGGSCVRELGIVVSAVHFNHKLRGKASDADEKFVAALAEKLGVTLHIGRADVAGKAETRKSQSGRCGAACALCVLRAAGETRLGGRWLQPRTAWTTRRKRCWRILLRGTGIAGLAGIHPVAGHVVRPLLGFRREELRKYLRSKRQPWREDATNRDTARTRARMRKKLLPLLEKQFNPAAIEHLAALAERAREQSIVRRAPGRANCSKEA